MHHLTTQNTTLVFSLPIMDLPILLHLQIRMYGICELPSSIMNNPTMSFQNAGFFDVSLIAYNVNGCTDTTTSTVNVLPIINADFALVYNIGCEPI